MRCPHSVLIVRALLHLYGVFLRKQPPSTVPSNRIEEGNGITVRSALSKISLFGKGFTNEKVTSRLFGGYGIDPVSGARNEPLDYLFRRRIYNTRRFHRARRDGWNIRGGVGYNFTSVVGAIVQLGCNSLGINSSTLSNLGFPGGDVHVFSATFDPIVHLTPHHHVDLYPI